METLLRGLAFSFLLLLICIDGGIGSSHDTAVSRHHHARLENTQSTCNKLFCVSVVSYCSIQEKCSCNPAVNCSCCRECAMCLGKFYEHCCDCVNMCEKNYTALLPTMASTVDALPDPNNELFRALTDEPVPSLRYTIVKFPVIEELALHHQTNTEETPFVMEHISGKGWTYSGMTGAEYWDYVQMELKGKVNFDLAMLCTVAYFDRCIPLNECRVSCDSMGATTFRWFHNGCCECVGNTCLNYGNTYPKCRECMTWIKAPFLFSLLIDLTKYSTYWFLFFNVCNCRVLLKWRIGKSDIKILLRSDYRYAVTNPIQCKSPSNARCRLRSTAVNQTRCYSVVKNLSQSMGCSTTNPFYGNSPITNPLIYVKWMNVWTKVRRALPLYAQLEDRIHTYIHIYIHQE